MGASFDGANNVVVGTGGVAVDVPLNALESDGLRPGLALVAPKSIWMRCLLFPRSIMLLCSRIRSNRPCASQMSSKTKTGQDRNGRAVKGADYSMEDARTSKLAIEVVSYMEKVNTVNLINFLKNQI